MTRTSFDSTYTVAHKGKFPLNPPPPLASFTKGPSSSRTQMMTAGVVPPKAPRNPYARPNSDKCYQCGQPGHRSNQCPKRGVVNLIGAGEETDLEAEGVEDETANTYKEDEITGGDDGELLSRSLVVRRLLLAPKQMEQSQQNNIF